MAFAWRINVLLAIQLNPQSRPCFTWVLCIPFDPSLIKMHIMTLQFYQGVCTLKLDIGIIEKPNKSPVTTNFVIPCNNRDKRKKNVQELSEYAFMFEFWWKHLKEANIVFGSGMECRLSERRQRQCVTGTGGALGSNGREFVFHSSFSLVLWLCPGSF